MCGVPRFDAIKAEIMCTVPERLADLREGSGQ
jgi:hypothetical protein